MRFSSVRLTHNLARMPRPWPLLAGLMALLFGCSVGVLSAATPVVGKARLTIVFILDGLRPDSIDPTETPNLYRLRQEGVNYLNPNQAFSTGDAANLLKLDEVSGGRLLFLSSLGEVLQTYGRSLAAVSSGSTGSALLLNHRAPQGVGYLVNGDLDPGVRVAYPDAVNTTISNRFGPYPSVGEGESADVRVNWTEDVLREYILPELQPTVVFNWLTEPDGTQHASGAGSPEALATIRNDDRNIGMILEQLSALGLADVTNIFVISDHGFSVHTFAVNVTQALIDAGLKASSSSDDVVLASSGQSLLLHVKNHDSERIRAIVRFLQEQEWIGVLFTAPRSLNRPRDPRGWVPGTFSLELIHSYNQERGADILLTFPWTSEKNVYGVPGTDFTTTAGHTGPVTDNSSGHGSMSPWTVHNTFFAWGVDFKDGINVRLPASNGDITPTILALLGIPDSTARDGRVLLEALNDGPDPEQVPVRTQVYTTEIGNYAAAIQVSSVQGHLPYVDKSWRLR